MSVPYVKPTYKKSEFNCPYPKCNVYAHQSWYKIIHYSDDEVSSLRSYETPKELSPEEIAFFSTQVGVSYTVEPRYPASNYKPTTEVVEYASLSRCSHCKQYAFWIKDKMVYPVVSLAPMPSDDMPDDVKADYMEAAAIVEASPRASSALLRLSLQKLMLHLKETGDLNIDIRNLVKKGLPEEIQQALDLVRVIGNESVHPGELNLKDDVETAYQLFYYLNLIVDERITRPKRLGAYYNKLPQSKLDGIKKRDKK